MWLNNRLKIIFFVWRKSDQLPYSYAPLFKALAIQIKTFIALFAWRMKARNSRCIILGPVPLMPIDPGPKTGATIDFIGFESDQEMS